MDFLEFFNLINWPYFLFIIISGYGITSRITKGCFLDRFKTWVIFIWALIVSIPFIGLNIYDGLSIKGVSSEYLITYSISTSLYELLVKPMVNFIVNKIKALFNTNTPN